MIVSKQWSRSIPTKSPVFLPAQKALPKIGAQAPDVGAMDAAFIETSDKFEHQSRRTILERVSVGFGDRYSKMKLTSVPAIDKGLIGKRLDVCLQ